jgi:hypothetical protein
MEYLTLQDIPHRHREPLHSRKMNTSHSAESPLANMVAAVSHDSASSSSLASPSPLSAPLFLEPALKAPSPALPDTFRTSGQAFARGDKAHGVMDQHNQDTMLPRSLAFPHHQRHTSPPQPRRQSNLHSIITPHPLEQDRSLDDSDACPRQSQRPPPHSSSTLTEPQNHHMRSSPPIQPGEQNFPGKLPSFSEVSISLCV